MQGFFTGSVIPWLTRMHDFLNQGIYERLCRKFLVDTTGALALFFLCFALCILVPYLLGSINSAVLVSRLMYRDDIRRHGSGNGGMTNMLRIFGVRAAIFTFIGDVLKTVLSLLFAFCMLGAGWVGHGFSFQLSAYLAGLFCIIGHIFPIYYRFHGGKGVLCTAVVIGMLSPWVLLVEVLIFIFTVAVTKYVSLGSILACATYPLFYNSLIKAFSGLSAPGEIVLLTFAIGLLIIWMHRGNITRLRNHEEPRLSFKKLKPPSPPLAGEIADLPKEEDDDDAEGKKS